MQFFDSSGEIIPEDGILTLDLDHGIHYLDLLVTPETSEDFALTFELLPVSDGGATVKAIAQAN